MTGPEHYREAERLLAESDKSEIFQYKWIHLAEVHATLALAAATAMAGDSHMTIPDCDAWREVASLYRPPGGAA